MKKHKAMAIIIFLLFPLLIITSITAIDTLSGNQSIIDDGSGATLVSSGGTFELGFFTPNNSGSPPASTNRYIGIWYKNIPVQTVVWVANRNTPLIASGGVLRLAGDGDLSLRDRSGSLLWSTNTPNVSNPILQLLDSGNLVLTLEGSSSSTYSWQSFDYPSDTLLPGMKCGWNLRTGLNRQLTSWKSSINPSPGAYTCGIDLSGVPEMFVWDGPSPMYRGRSWDGRTWGGAAPFNHNGIINFYHVVTEDEVYFIYNAINSSLITRLVLGGDGALRRLVWQSVGGWVMFWYIPMDPCDGYDHCGAYGICSSSGGTMSTCTCMTGFEQRPPAAGGGGGAGCVRRRELDCSEGEDFAKVRGVKLPDTTKARVVKSSIGFNQCRDGCLKNCTCVAFAFLNEGSGCITWTGDLRDVRDFSEGGGEDLYVRIAASKLGRKKQELRIIVIVIISLLPIIIISVICFVKIRRKRNGVVKYELGIRDVSTTQQSVFALNGNMEVKLGGNMEKGSELSSLDFLDIVEATNNFSDWNKLGEGGFGQVYKGQLSNGQEIAIKRLEENSGQGLEEFKNEIQLISRLQHKNLVRLLGYCIQQEEKILIYEYMPNRSLDLFLFDLSRAVELSWHQRYHIIEGIAQGILYLHKHSRIRIIHRDLKASNILLDGDMNPKISDFGMARIFGSNEAQEKTRRVVGTYGYMPPEYAMKGIFSIKYDVFSFGVIVLEIVSGKRNNKWHQHEKSLNLLGYAWVLWKEGKCLELMDPSLSDRFTVCQIYKCIHLALMCVQESASDRPTMSDVITMMSSETATFPDPKKPAFFNMRIATGDDSTSSYYEMYSLNNVSMTTVDGR